MPLFVNYCIAYITTVNPRLPTPVSAIVTHFAGEETEARRSEITWPWSIASKGAQTRQVFSPTLCQDTVGPCWLPAGARAAGHGRSGYGRAGTPWQCSDASRAQPLSGTWASSADRATWRMWPDQPCPGKVGGHRGGPLSSLQGERMMGAVR